MAARSESCPIRAMRSRNPAPLLAANWLPVCRRSWKCSPGVPSASTACGHPDSLLKVPRRTGPPMIPGNTSAPGSGLMQQEGELVRVSTLTHGLSDEEGGYHWSGELRLWDNEIFTGWYASTEGAIRDKGTMYFILHPHGLTMAGRWVGISNDGKIITGWGSMAKERTDDVKAFKNRMHLDLETDDVEAEVRRLFKRQVDAG